MGERKNKRESSFYFVFVPLIVKEFLIFRIWLDTERRQSHRVCFYVRTLGPKSKNAIGEGLIFVLENSSIFQMNFKRQNDD